MDVYIDSLVNLLSAPPFFLSLFLFLSFLRMVSRGRIARGLKGFVCVCGTYTLWQGRKNIEEGKEAQRRIHPPVSPCYKLRESLRKFAGETLNLRVNLREVFLL